MAHYNPTDLTEPKIMKELCPTNTRAINPVYFNNIKVGHYVKIRNECEYFWVEVKEINGDNITGKIYYQLGINSYAIEDTLTFRKCYIFDVFDPQVFNLIPGINI